MKVVLDTNILLVSISKRSNFRWIFDAFLDEKLTFCVTTDILNEYDEILSRYLGKESANVILQILENAPNVEFTTRYFKWYLVKNDADDDKFVDCFVASEANFLVTHDKHFNILKNVPFPKINIISAQDLKNILQL